MLPLLGWLLRVYSYVFVSVLCLMALALAVVIVASPHNEVRLGWLPWTGPALPVALGVSGLLGLLVVFLAVSGRLRFPLALFALAALAIVTRGLFFSTWQFHGAGEMANAVYLVLAMTAAFVGSVPLPKSKGRDYPHDYKVARVR